MTQTTVNEYLEVAERCAQTADDVEAGLVDQARQIYATLAQAYATMAAAAATRDRL